jgi:hypothetical protein
MAQAFAKTAASPLAPPAALTAEEFAARFDRCFARAWAYVSRRVNDRESCERIVREVLAGNLDLLVHPAGQVEELRRLEAASDRLIELKNHQRPPPIQSQG